MKTNSEIYRDDADSFFKRNVRNENTVLAEQLLNILPKNILKSFDVAEFGCGPSHNLFLLNNFVRRVHGYDISMKSVDYFQKLFSGISEEKYAVFHSNLCLSFEFPIIYDLILLGWFTYYASNDELCGLKRNIDNALNDKGYLFINDFIIRDSLREKKDTHNDKLRIYKRNITFWIKFFSNYDLVDFRLYDCGIFEEDKLSDDYSKVNTKLTQNDEGWIFTALFRKNKSCDICI